MSTNSVRFIFKRDDESSIGRGAVIRAAHFRPEIAVIFRVVANTAPLNHLPDNEVWVTEGDRPQRVPGRRDLHTELRALDFSCMRLIASTEDERYSISSDWESEIQDQLGPDYDVVLHGGSTNLHLHIELDPS